MCWCYDHLIWCYVTVLQDSEKNTIYNGLFIWSPKLFLRIYRVGQKSKKKYKTGYFLFPVFPSLLKGRHRILQDSEKKYHLQKRVLIWSSKLSLGIHTIGQKTQNMNKTGYYLTLLSTQLQFTTQISLITNRRPTS